MRKKTPPVESDVAESVQRALEAAATAVDSAEEAAGVSEAAEKALAQAASAQRKLTALAGGTLLAGLLSAGLGTMVYMRSVADLRQAAELQSAATLAMVEQIKAISEKLAEAETVLSDTEGQRMEIVARIDGLGDRISGDISVLAESASQMQPQFASAIQKHVDEGLKATRSEILNALAEMELGGSGASNAQIEELLAALRAQMAPTAKPKNASAPKPTAQTKKQPTTGRQSAPAPKNPFSYP